MGRVTLGLSPAVPSAAVEEIREKMKTVRHRILVLSGKGGVGKSTFSAHLAHGLAEDEDTQVRAGVGAAAFSSGRRGPAP